MGTTEAGSSQWNWLWALCAIPCCCLLCLALAGLLFAMMGKKGKKKKKPSREYDVAGSYEEEVDVVEVPVCQAGGYGAQTGYAGGPVTGVPLMSGQQVTGRY